MMDQLAQSLLAPDVLHPLLVVVLFILPKILLRFQIPAAISAFLLGVLFGLFSNALEADPTLKMLATIGISALFLQAGLEIEPSDLKLHRKVILSTIISRVLFIGLVVYGVNRWGGLPLGVSVLLSLALVTPSAGFILNSLSGTPLPEEQRFWVKLKIISFEIASLAILFAVLQTESWTQFFISVAILVPCLLAIPKLLRAFEKRITPYAPHSELGFLILLAVVMGVITRKLGTYYILGAFLVGLTERLYRTESTPEANHERHKFLSIFIDFFIPFYFFFAGLQISAKDLILKSLLMGLGLFVLVVPLRLLLHWFMHKWSVKSSGRDAFLSSVVTIPNLVFGLALAGILREKFFIPRPLFGGLVVYSILTSIFPTIFFVVRKRVLHSKPGNVELPSV